jgi:hypothetical protein
MKTQRMITQSSNLTLFYNELNMFLFNTGFHSFKTKTYSNQIFINKKNAILIQDKYFMYNKKKKLPHICWVYYIII